jgi:hypothetical protein
MKFIARHSVRIVSKILKKRLKLGFLPEQTKSRLLSSNKKGAVLYLACAVYRARINEREPVNGLMIIPEAYPLSYH